MREIVRTCARGRAHAAGASLLLTVLVGCGSGPGSAASLQQESASPAAHAGSQNPIGEERAAGRVLSTRTAHGTVIAPAPGDAAPTVTREQAWDSLKNTRGASQNADLTWVLLAEFSADHPAEDPGMDGVNVQPMYQHRLAWVLFMFRLPGEGAMPAGPGGPFCRSATCPARKAPAFIDVIAAIDARSGAHISEQMVGYPYASSTRASRATPAS